MEERTADVGPLRLVWWLPEDRWRHRIEWVDAAATSGTTPCVWAETVEGDFTNEWPVSPAFQDLFVEDKGNGATEFQLMGQCGRTIYSAAVLCDPSRKRIDFDVCARTRREPEKPGLVSTYVLRPPTVGGANTPVTWVLTDAGAGRAEAFSAGDRWQVGFVPPLIVDTIRGTLYRWRYAVVCE